MKCGPAGGILLLCYGNPARLDDGLGPAFAAAVEKLALPGVVVETDYQLSVEDASAAASHDAVVFVDAAVAGEEPFFFKPVRPRAALSFSSHSLEPAHVLALAQDLFGRAPKGYSLGIRGYAFNDFGEQISPAAQVNLGAALQFLVRALEHGDFSPAGKESGGGGRDRDAENGD